MTAQIQSLLNRGVVLPEPGTVHLGPDVAPERIQAGTVLHPGCRLMGRALSIGPGCELGEEGPVTLRDCQLDARVTVRGGYLSGATLLEGVDCGDGTHVRPGSLLEEYASIAHSNGLKQTVLMPFVSVGSLTNFCDVLMAGGSGDANHSEVGSSYIHFNFTPHQDKATASLIGDVPQGVLLDQEPIFLGGQGGLVGPCRIAYGSVVAAGIVVRKDMLQRNLLLLAPGGTHRVVSRPYRAAIFGPVERILANNLIYIGNLLALRAWYTHARAPFLSRTPWGEACLEGARTRLSEGLEERIKRLGQLAAKLSHSAQTAAAEGHRTDLPPFVAQERFAQAWEAVRSALHAAEARQPVPPVDVADTLRRMTRGTSYIEAVQGLEPARKPPIVTWLQGIVDEVAGVFRG